MPEIKDLELYYFDSVKGSSVMGRGETIRLLLEDAGLDFKYIRYSFADWPAKKEELLAQKVRDPTMPFIFVNGERYAKTFPIMRVLSKKLGKYEGRNEKENELLDVCSDMILDWGFKWAIALFFGKDEDYAKHGKEELPKLYKSWNDILSDSPSGPYVLGDHISYVDFGLYHIIEDDQSADLLKGNKTEYPHLVKFIEAMNSRPNLSKYLATERK